MAGGALTGFPSANKFVREKRMARARETLETQLGPYLRLVNKEIVDSCHDLLARLKTALAHEFDLRIADAEMDLRQREEALQRGLGAERETIAERVATLRAEIGQVETHRAAATAARNGFQRAES